MELSELTSKLYMTSISGKVTFSSFSLRTAGYRHLCIWKDLGLDISTQGFLGCLCNKHNAELFLNFPGATECFSCSTSKLKSSKSTPIL